MPKYGEVLYKGTGWFRPRNFKEARPFCYRIDPVPGIHSLRGWFKSWYKTGINCLPEKRVYHEHKPFVRLKRSVKNLPNVWDDYRRSDVRTRKCWKNKKVRKQWQKNLW